MESTRSNPFSLNHHHQYAASSSSANDWNSSPYQYPIGGGGGDRARGPHPPTPPPCLYGGGGEGGSHNPDPHLMCLKLGKRHYFGDGACHVGERGKKPYHEVGGGVHSGVTVAAAPPSSAVARCQVDGCNAALVNAKEYHRRHKVCQMHSKAPRVVVLGLEQRFCQQCSRFHAVGEFDDTKRSCRRRLAGHNERRRKTSQDQSTPRNQPHPVNRKMMTYGGRHPVEFAESSNGCALSLLSSKKDSPSWISSPDLPAMCSAALRELIAENRAAILARQLSLPPPPPPPPHHHHHHHQQHQHHQLQPQYQQQMGAAGSHLTLDLMQAPTSEFGFLSVRGRAKEDENDDEGCPNLWGNSFRGTHAV